MIEFIIFSVMTATLIYVSSINYKKYEQKMPSKSTKVLIVLSRFVQLLTLIYIVVSMYQITYFIFERGRFPQVLNTVNFNENAVSAFDWGPPIVILFGIINNALIFGILEFTIQILKDFSNEVSFSEKVVERFRRIANLFIIKIFVSIVITYITTATLSFNYEYLIIYGLMIVLIKYFIHGKTIQEDSDLSI
ncbi:hypothetical protein [Haloplasma contractile]|uniref:Uncharacterized protein n=1 Tax=Haloplasma contractile SSD-17B TaxID=1033810 RepID=F7PTU2_9MOLU|nr:hypothetical protein [Haloplasma contractile]ERJ12255.1 hypothetical protein HLPCO_001782 [Haloplasma contractile SSD-17B]